MFLHKRKKTSTTRIFTSRYYNIFIYLWWSLVGLDKIISQRDKGTSIGFGADVKNTQDKKTGEWMKALEPEDLLSMV